MLATSKDLLFIALAFCAVWLTLFMSWLIYYTVMIVRDVSRLVRRSREVVEKVDAFTAAVHEKFERSAGSFALVGQALKEIVAFAIKERAKKAASTRRKKAAEVFDEEGEE